MIGGMVAVVVWVLQGVAWWRGGVLRDRSVRRWLFCGRRLPVTAVWSVLRGEGAAAAGRRLIGGMVAVVVQVLHGGLVAGRSAPQPICAPAAIFSPSGCR